MNLSFRISIYFLLCLQQLSCNNAGNQSKSKAESKKDIGISSEGAYIDYTDSKTGDTTLLFIHGWGIDKTYWENQIVYFAGKYRVVAVDLPGFGKSGKNRKSWTVQNYGKDISAVLTELDLKNVILVGHSMSGAIAVEAALENPARIVGLVGVDNFKNFGAIETPAEKIETANFYKAIKEHYRETVNSYASQALFSPSTNVTVRQRVLTDITRADSVIAIDCLKKNDAYPVYEKLISYKKPLYLINSSATPTDTSAFKKKNVPCYLFDIGPTGHYPMIERPDAFDVLLEQAIAKIGTSN